MKKGISLSLCILSAAVIFTACGSSETANVTTEITTETITEAIEASSDVQEEMQENSAEVKADIDTNQRDEFLKEHVSNLGYSLVYNTKLFEESDDTFTAKNTEMPVFISIKEEKELSIDDLVDGLSLQSGKDDFIVDESYIGAEGEPAKIVSYTENVNGVETYHSFYVLENGSKILLIEACSNENDSMMYTAEFEEMFGTFKLTNN